MSYSQRQKHLHLSVQENAFSINIIIADMNLLTGLKDKCKERKAIPNFVNTWLY